MAGPPRGADFQTRTVLLPSSWPSCSFWLPSPPRLVSTLHPLPALSQHLCSLAQPQPVSFLYRASEASTGSHQPERLGGWEETATSSQEPRTFSGSGQGESSRGNESLVCALEMSTRKGTPLCGNLEVHFSIPSSTGFLGRCLPSGPPQPSPTHTPGHRPR